MALIDNPEAKKALESRCKHGMILEYCGVCQRVNYTKTVRFPIEVKDKDTGKDITIMMRKEVDRHYFMRYR